MCPDSKPAELCEPHFLANPGICSDSHWNQSITVSRGYGTLITQSCVSQLHQKHTDRTWNRRWPHRGKLQGGYEKSEWMLGAEAAHVQATREYYVQLL